ncbi:MAG TPA: hypothetical protein VF105_02755 [Gemmatimonadaceae bacterium]
MKVFAFTLALAGVASAASLNAQAVPRPGTVITGTSQRRTDCSYNRTTNSVGDIIFGRTNLNTNTDCRDVYSREDGSWYQVGRGRDNNSIYERRVRDANGNLVIQRARRNPNGTFTIFSSRVANSNDKEWRKIQKERAKQIRKEQKERDKEFRKANKDRDNNRIDRDDDDDDDDRRVSGGVFGSNGRVLGVSNSSERGDHGRGKGRKGRDD